MMSNNCRLKLMQCPAAQDKYGKWYTSGANKEYYLTSSTSLGEIIKGGDIIILSPATRTSIPRFSHSDPNMAPTPEIIIVCHYDLCYIPSCMHRCQHQRLIYCTENGIIRKHKNERLPHSEGNIASGDLSVNSVPSINPVPRICM